MTTVTRTHVATIRNQRQVSIDVLTEYVENQ
jgi:hypothetical protein